MNVAIVGMGCRFPGGADSPAQFWTLLRDGVDAVTEMPSDRFDLDALFDADSAVPGKFYTRWGGFLDGIDAFDADFFGISPREARGIDPQQRLLLEVVWEALEDGGQVPDQLAGTNAGVFVGISTHDYLDVQVLPHNRHRIDAHINSGTAACITANRVSYLLDLHGPSFTVDTACSSSLTAVHLACHSLASGECELAIAGGVGVILTPEATIGFCKASMLSPHGRCRAFDAGADGFVRSEGSGAVILKPLARAIADGDPIHAVIRSSAVNQDGHTTGLTVPSAAAQREMIEQAHRDAGVDPADVQYVEAHGTGTPVGDPIEAEAIGSALSADRAADDPCVIGSAKTNVGHLEAAAGIAGLIKTVLALTHRQIPPNLHFSTPNPAIPFAELGLRVPTELEPWPSATRPALAGVNSFGFGGANAHVLLEASPAPTEPSVVATERAVHVLTISARSPQALRDLAGRHRVRLDEDDDVSLHDVCYSTTVRRSHHCERLAVVARSRAEAIGHLDAFLDGKEGAGFAVGHAHKGRPPRMAFVFGGMGPQWWGMGRQLQEHEPVFRQTLEEVDAVLRPLAGWSLLEELSKDEETSRVGDADIAHVANLALQLALAALWRSWGVVPDAVVGHSSGEMAAACVSGALTLTDAVPLAFHRGRLQHRTTGTGRMLAAAISPEEARRAIAGHEHEVALAAINAPGSVTLSGAEDALERIAETISAEQRFVRFLPVRVPYHGPQMETIREEFLTALRGLSPGPSDIPLVSAVTGEGIDGRRLDADYWWRNVRQPVRFAAATERLVDDGCDLFVEVGPHPVLAAPLAESLAEHGSGARVLPSLRRGEDEGQVILGTLADLHVHGRTVHWPGVYPSGAYVALPSYPWQRERHWFDSGDNPTPRGARSAGVETGHPLLGRRLPFPQPIWETSLDDRTAGYLDAHVVQGAVIFPGAGYLEMALAAGRELWGDEPVRVEDVRFRQLLSLGSPRRAVLQLHYHPRDAAVEIHSNQADDNGSWSLHATARLVRDEAIGTEPLDLQALQARYNEPFSVATHYGFFERRGYDFGEAFRSLQEIWLGDDGALARVAFPPGVDIPADGHRTHPALLDGALQLFGAVSARTANGGHGEETFFPVSVRRVTFRHDPGVRFWAYVALRHGDAANVEDMEGDAWLIDENGEIALTLEGLRMRVFDEGESTDAAGIDDWLYELRWEEAPLGAAPPGGAQGLRHAPDVAAVLEAGSGRPEDASDMTRYLDVVEPQVDRVAEGFTLSALESLGWRPERDASQPIEHVAAALGVVARHQRLFAALVDMVRARMREGTDALEAVTRDHVTLNRMLDALIAAEPQHTAEVELLRRGGTHLAGILRGETDAREVMLTEDALQLLTRFYTTSPPCRSYHQLLADAVGVAVDGVGDSTPLRVLEIGAGTGAATTAILPRLPAGSTFTFTDISPYFRDEAKVRLAQWPGVRFATLDIEADPAAQGFEANSFDLVFAANVLHVTEDLRTTLHNVRRLLAENGLLALMELTRRSRWLNLVFGLLDGWWRFTDVHLRTGGPMLEPGQWHEVLEASGFERVTSLYGDAADERTVQTVQLAHAPAPTQTASPTRDPAAPRQWLVFTDAAGVGDGVTAALRRQGHRCTRVRPGSAFARHQDGSFDLPPQDEDAYAQLLEEVQAHGALHGVVHAWSLHAPARADVDTASLMAGQQFGCGSVRSLVRALDAVGGPVPEMWLVTAGAQSVEGHDDAPHVSQSPLWGLGRSLMSEHDARCRLIDLAPDPTPEDAEALAEELTTGDEEEVALRGRVRFARRLRRVSLAERARPSRVRQLSPETDAFRLEFATPGAIESALLREAPPLEPGPGEVSIRVWASGLNFRDVLQALDMLPAATYAYDRDPGGIGNECAGVVLACGEGAERFSPGDEVLTQATAAHGSRVVAREDLTVAKPERLSFEEAASILGGFVTAEYALNHVARIVAGDRVLIHSATGGVGLAAIQLCKQAGAEIFATAGTSEKRAYLRTLGIEHVMNSRSLAFADEVLRATAGEGVDVILNSLSGEATTKGLAILRPYGRFVELGKRDIAEDAHIGLSPFQRNRSYHAVDLVSMTADRPDMSQRLMEHVVRQITDGALEVVPTTAFDLADAEQALRFMAQAKHIGKVVLTTGQGTYPVHARAEASRVDPRGTYLITGGLGGFGLTVAEWLARQGAGSIVLMSRSGVPQDGPDALDALYTSPAQVSVVHGDVSDEDDVERVVDEIRRELPPLKGVFHAAMVLDDDRLVGLDQARFDRVLAPKIAGAWNLHRLTRADDLDHFVLFSSVAGVMGVPLQSNYAAANAFLDTLAAHRRGRGLPGLSVAWGALADVGYVSRHGELGQYLERGGFQSFTTTQALGTLEGLLRHDFDQVMAASMDWHKWAQVNPLGTAASRRFRDLVAERDMPSAGDAGPASDSALSRLGDAAPADRLAVLSDHLVQKIARVLGTTPQKIDPERPFTELGFDSLMAVELGTAIRAELGVKVPVVAILQGTNAHSLAERVLGQLTLDTAEAATVQDTRSPGAQAQAEPETEYPLSFEQRRFWFLDRLHPGTTVYNISVAARLSGTLDVTALERSLSEVVKRHEMLRAAIRDADGTPLQRFLAPEPASLPVVDLGHLAETERDAELQRLATEEIQRPFDLGQGPLMRVTLFRLTQQEHVALLIVHHIAADAWAMNMLVRDIAVLYEAFTRGQPSPLSPPPLRYLDHIHQQAQFDDELMRSQLAYWQRQLAGAPAGLRLPAAPKALASTHGSRGAHQRFELSVEVTDALRAFSQREGATLFMTLLAAFQTLLYRYSGDEDLCVGTAVSTRTQPGTEVVAGCFMNTVILRADLSGEPSFREFLYRVRETTLEALEHEDAPFERVVEALQPDRAPGDNPLFEAMLVLHNARLPELQLAGLDLEQIEVEGGTAVTDLLLLLDDGDQLGGRLEYDAERFDPATVERMLVHFGNILEAVVVDPEQRLSALPLLTDAERHHVLVDYNKTTTNYGTAACLHRLVEAQVEHSPDATAVLSEDADLTYRELDHRANQLARHLRGLGVGPNVTVGVYLPRSWQTVVAALGILKAGGGYLPLEPTLPADRLRFMLDDAQPAVLVTQQPLLDRLPEHHTAVVALDTDWAQIGATGADTPAEAPTPDDLAYVIYTSGSTGEPKGVMVPHRAICNQVRWRQKAFALSDSDTVLQRTPLGFDPSVWELFGPLVAGARLVMAPTEAERDICRLVQLLAERHITTLQVVPSVLEALLEQPDFDDCRDLRRVFCGGEPLPPDLAERFLARLPAELHNLYGPTEAAIDATHWTCRRSDGRSVVPIGRPIANARVFLLDDRFEPVPVGVPGELHIGGAGLARGYHNQPALTAERFIQDPFTPGERLYRTGDIGCWLPDATIAFVGRADRQVTIRGFRVELGEIEAALTRHPAVGHAAVVPFEQAAGGPQLAAFVTADQPATARDLQEYAAERLPEYMVPACVTLLDALPRTVSGKVDHTRLAEQASTPERASAPVTARDAVERELVRIWEGFFPGAQVGVTDDFFVLGGHSLLAMRVIAQIQRAFDQELPVSSLLENRTIERLACLLREQALPRSPLVTIQPHGPERPFFWVHPVSGTVYCYAELAAELGEHRPLYGLEAAGLSGEDEPHTRIEDMAHYYVEELERVQGTGPYLLGGWSMGGLIAFEMARQLEERGEPVALLTVVDVGPGTLDDDAADADAATALHSFVEHLGLSLDELTVSNGEFGELSADAQLACILEHARRWHLVPPDMELPGLQRHLQVVTANIQALRSYTPASYPGPVVLVEAREPLGRTARHTPRWDEVAHGGVTRHTVPGDHHTMLHPPHVAVLARQLSACLDEVENLVAP